MTLIESPQPLVVNADFPCLFSDLSLARITHEVLLFPTRYESKMVELGIPVPNPVGNPMRGGIGQKLYQFYNREFGYPHLGAFTLVTIPNVLLQLAVHNEEKNPLPTLFAHLLSWYLSINTATLQLDSEFYINGCDVFPIRPAMRRNVIQFNNRIHDHFQPQFRFALTGKGDYLLGIAAPQAEVVGLMKRHFKNLRFGVETFYGFLSAPLNCICFRGDGTIFQLHDTPGMSPWDAAIIEEGEHAALAFARARKLSMLH